VIGRGRLLADTSVADLLRARDRRLHELTPHRAPLEDAYMRLTEGPPTTSPTRPRRGKVDMHGAIGRALRAEWTKARSVRSTTWATLALVVGTVGLSALSCATGSTEGGSPASPGDDDIVLFSLSGVYLGQIAVVVLATLAITSEFATDIVRATFAAIPRRASVLVAKAVVVTSIALVVGTITCVLSFLVGQWLLRGNGYVYEGGYPTASLTDGATARAVFGAGLYLGVLAVLSLGVGAVVRHTAGAISAVLAVLFVPQIMIGLLSDDVADVIQRVTPMSAGLAVLQTTDRDILGPSGPWAGLAVAAAWAGAALLAGLWMVHRRDA
jgi:ABC-2 type transport system permease protein